MFKQRALSAILASVTLFSVMSPSSAHAEEIPTSFSFTGSGYGHGVGMSQIGARGQALEGRSAPEILGYYYPGTQVQSVSDSQTIRVNIGHLLNQTTISLVNGATSGGNGEFSISSGDGQLIGTYGRDLTATFTLVTGIIIPQLTSPTAKFAPLKGDSLFTISWTPNSMIRIGNETATTTSQYKYGFLTIKAVSTVAGPKLEVVNTLRLHDEYLWGIGEVPSSWPAAALEAQAIASRTYALTKISTIRKECDCNLYNTIADQNFVGFSKESEPIYGQLWKSAVNRTSTDSTSGLVVTFNGKPANTYFFSSSAGLTQDVRDVWGGTFPYLISVPDTWSVSTALNPRYYLWNRDISQKVMATAFGLPDIVSYRVLARSKSGSVTSIQGYSSSGKYVKLTGEVFRSRVKLPSTWFGLTFAVIPIDESDDCQLVSIRARGRTAPC
jgi:SpoIID/LytB domain protein